MTNPPKYHPVLVTLHWLLAVLIIGNLIFAISALGDTPNTAPEKLFLLKVHLLTGLVILLLMLCRVFVRVYSLKPERASTGKSLLNRLGPITHWAMYVLVFLVAGSGLAIAWQAHLFAVLFQQHGSLPADFKIFPPRLVHGLFATLLILTIVLHLIGALYHQFVRRDRLMSRMSV